MLSVKKVHKYRIQTKNKSHLNIQLSYAEGGGDVYNLLYKLHLNVLLKALLVK